ncbi:metallophosphoesterase family protein [Peribacillus frigoritolerans]|uniref:metallophosphoesterase n=1 Tax=Peribacillus frigoritolerans TaxID=450367 RepID=UPI002E1B118A|nr:metallophosphoesterase [Peribacillus frigoritolerans]MED4634013.1 metallophosphoesterase family protein [Peribacillus frigoritolerans]
MMLWLSGLFLIIILLSFAMIFYMWRTAMQDRVISQDLYFKDFPEGFGDVRIFFISDLHRRIVADKLIEETRDKADLVIIGGDIRESGVPLERVEKNILKLKELGPLYFVWGNNDYEGDFHELDATLLKHGVKILDNTAVSFESQNGSKIALLGIDDISEERDRLDLALSDCGNEDFRILVSHNPLVKKQLNPEHHISLVLSGHTHGGQIRIFGFGPYQIGSVKKEGDCIYMTSNGYGTSAMPLRLEAKPETHLFTLKRGADTEIGKAVEKTY